MEELALLAAVEADGDCPDLVLLAQPRGMMGLHRQYERMCQSSMAASWGRGHAHGFPGGQGLSETARLRAGNQPMPAAADEPEQTLEV